MRHEVLDTLCPMHAVVDATGHILHAGPTLRRLWDDATPQGRRFFELFELIAPRGVSSHEALIGTAGRKLRLRVRSGARTRLCGVLAPLGDGTSVINLSFGIGIVEAVRDHALNAGDFAPTDLAVEMLFLVEAKSAAMEALRDMSLRFHGARMAAEEQALSDPVTGLRNRRALDLVLEQMIGSGLEFALMHVDLDHFKQVNDTHGHAAGDAILRHVAASMAVETRADDTVARVGGDEFVLVFQGQCDRDRLAEIARRLIERVEKPVTFEGAECRVSASAGTAISTDYPAPDPDVMLADADAALYAAKRAGRGRHRFHDPRIAASTG